MFVPGGETQTFDNWIDRSKQGNKEIQDLPEVSVALALNSRGTIHRVDRPAPLQVTGVGELPKVRISSCEVGCWTLKIPRKIYYTRLLG